MKKIIIALILFLLLGQTVYADTYEYTIDDQTDSYTSLYSDLQIDSLYDSTPEDVQELIDELEIDPKNYQSMQNLTGGQFFEKLLNYLKNYIFTPFKTAALVLMVILLCAVAACMSKEGNAFETLNMTATLICISTLILPVTELIARSTGVLTAACAFMTTVIPVFAGILIAAMRAGTALGFQSLLFIATQIVSTLSSYVIAPFSSMYLCIGISGAASGNGQLNGLAALIKKIAVWTLTFVMTVFMILFSFQSFINSGADSAAGKTAKFFVSTAVPIIGAPVSEAFGSLASCMSILKSTAGMYVVIVLLALILPVLIEVILYKFILMFCSVVAGLYSITPVSALADAVNAALSIVMAVLICVAVMFIFCITITVSAGGGV